MMYDVGKGEYGKGGDDGVVASDSLVQKRRFVFFCSSRCLFSLQLAKSWMESILIVLKRRQKRFMNGVSDE